MRDAHPEAAVAEGERLFDPHGPRNEPFLPYRPGILSATLPLEVRRVRLDGADLTGATLKPERLRVCAYAVDDWDELELDLALADPTENVRRRAFESGDPAALIFLARLSCPTTLLRLAAALRPSEDGHWKGSLRLRRDDVERTAFFEAVALRAAPSTGERADEASFRHSLLARSPRWRIDVSEPPPPPGRAFDVAYVDFADPRPDGVYSGEDAASLRRTRDALSHVAFAPAGPIVLINKRRPEVTDVLLARGTVGLRARIRDVLLRQIATSAWRAMVLEAAARVDLEFGTDPSADDEAADLGDLHWTTRVLDHAARALFPREGARARERLLAALADDALRPGTLFELSERLGRVGQDPVLRLIEEATRR